MIKFLGSDCLTRRRGRRDTSENSTCEGVCNTARTIALNETINVNTCLPQNKFKAPIQSLCGLGLANASDSSYTVDIHLEPGTYNIDLTGTTIEAPVVQKRLGSCCGKILRCEVLPEGVSKVIELIVAEAGAISITVSGSAADSCGVVKVRLLPDLETVVSKDNIPK